MPSFHTYNNGRLLLRGQDNHCRLLTFLFDCEYERHVAHYKGTFCCDVVIRVRHSNETVISSVSFSQSELLNLHLLTSGVEVLMRKKCGKNDASRLETHTSRELGGVP